MKYPVSKMPEYLLNQDSLTSGEYYLPETPDLKAKRNITIKYGAAEKTLKKLDGLVIGEYTLRVPKKTHEVCLGGLRLNNCMSIYGHHLMSELKEDSKTYLKQNKYLDIHVLKNGKLVGCLAAENIFKKKIVPSCGYGLFINAHNGGNQSMDHLLIPAINKVLKLKLKEVEVRNDIPLIA